MIVNVPGSAKAAKECFDILLPVLVHAVAQLRNDLKAVRQHHDHIQRVMPASSGDIKTIESGRTLQQDKTKVSVQHTSIAERPRKSPFPMLSIHEAMQIILQQVDLGTLKTEEIVSIDGDRCIGAVLSQNISVPFDLPPFDASLKDGYAVRSEDGVGDRCLIGSPRTAGSSDKANKCVVEPGQCVRISTGAPLPDGCDAVVQVEDTELQETDASGREEQQIRIVRSASKGQDIRPAGSDAKKGDLMLASGVQLKSIHMGICASIGISQVRVWQKPTIAVLSTGDELLQPGQPLQPSKVYDSNTVALRTLLKEHHFESILCEPVKDCESDLVARIGQAFDRTDVLITSGGVSMGERDLLKSLLVSHFNAKIHFGRINMKPGKPFTFATCRYKEKLKLVFALPGNPVSAFVTCRLFVLPALARLSGCRLDSTLEQQLKSNAPIDWLFKVHRTCQVYVSANELLNLGHSCCDDDRPEFVRAQIEYGSLIPAAGLIKGGQASSRMLSMADADILVYLEMKTGGNKKAIFL